MRTLLRSLLIVALLASALATPGCGLIGGSYYRLRGSPEIHQRDCPRLRNAQRGGIVYADFGDGPPCYVCLHSDALDWAADPD